MTGMTPSNTSGYSESHRTGEGCESPALRLGLNFIIESSAVDALFARLRSEVEEVVCAQLAKVESSRRAEPRVHPAASRTNPPSTEILPEARARAANVLNGTPAEEVQAEDGLIDMKTVARLMKVAQRTAYRFLSMGAMPKPLRLSGKVVRWRADEIRSWIENGCPPQDRWEEMRDRRFANWPTKRGRPKSPPR
jgi:predicted DNA-binding transcriptional regulator AlpA